MPPDVCVMLPTVRDSGVVGEYVANARRHGFDLDRLHVVLITEDFCDVASMASRLEAAGVSGAVFDGRRREDWFQAHDLADFAHLVPEASHAQTSFGLLYAWAEGFDVGVFLDDDTRPHADQDFFGRHLRNLGYEGELEVAASDERWVNVLHHRHDHHGLYPRGYPYGAMAETVTTRTDHVSDVVASQGLWTGVPDLDAVRVLEDGALDGRARTRTTAADFPRDFAVAPGNYLTVCSMNLAFRRAVIPAFYQLPMDDNPWGVGRFDDIWSGVFLKRACDILGKQVYTGRPLCVHEKAPRSTFQDLAAEAPALELNEHLWQIVDGVGGDANSFAEAYAAMADQLVAGDWSDLENGGFLSHVGEHMHDWLECLAAIEPPVTRRVPADD